ncbi:decarboxylase [Halomonas nitroreducens]|uniref:Decarboxylase n=1 Tax=Halomonas nitroreducens TaxID=447425 RepID=A0A431V603_9GAMM|nr:decarboxylase [Halomonas nitroreducens]RTR05937.1 decarboxylase [Halomonas nitroreducens]
MMSRQYCLGILLPDDGPGDYEWYDLAAPAPGELPAIEVGKIPSDGHHAPPALRALGAPARLEPVGRQLVEAGAGTVVWACTSASFIGGLGWARDQAGALADALGVPVTSTALAFLEALDAIGHCRVDLLSPYPDDVTLRLVSFLREAGVSVREDKALDCPYAADSHQADLLAEIRRFRDQHPDTSVPLLVPDTAVNSLARLAALGREAGSVVLTANQVTLWAGLKRLGWRLRPDEAFLGDLALL